MRKSVYLLMLLAIVFTGQAQEKKVESKNKASSDLANLQLAYQLANYGYKTYSPTALIEAARIMSEVKTQELKYESYQQEPAPQSGGTKLEKEGYDLTSILEAAKKYSSGDPALMAAIANIEKSRQTTRGRVGGPAEKYTFVYGNTTDTYDIAFREGELAEIYIRGDGDTDLDLYVYDSLGNIIKKDDDYTDVCYVNWVPLWTGRYIVRIVNRGPILNNYRLLTN